MLTQRNFKLPVISYVPAIEYTVKKNNRMTIVSLSSGMELMRACISTFRPFTDEIVFSGLITRNTLKPAKSIADSSFCAPISTIPDYDSTFYISVNKVM